MYIARGIRHTAYGISAYAGDVAKAAYAGDVAKAAFLERIYTMYTEYICILNIYIHTHTEYIYAYIQAAFLERIYT